MTILDAIGQTPLVELRRVPPAGSARVLVKLEYANPTGSMKGRMVQGSVVRQAVDSGTRYNGAGLFRCHAS